MPSSPSPSPLLSTKINKILADINQNGKATCSARSRPKSTPASASPSLTCSLKSTKKSSEKSNGKSKKEDSKYQRMYADLYEQETSVTELKLRDFEYDATNKILRCKNPAFTGLKRGIIIFYAPWCPHCNKIYDDVVELSLNYMNIFPIGVVNIEDDKNKNDILTHYAEVGKYPTMKIIDREMIVRNYNNDITRDNITYYINMNI